MVLLGSRVENQLIALNQCAYFNYGFLSLFVFKTFPIFDVRARADNAPAELNASRDESFRVVQSDVPTPTGPESQSPHRTLNSQMP